MLMMESAAIWISYNDSETYTLTQIFPNISLRIRLNRKNERQIAVCNSCKNLKTRRYPPLFSSIPSEITSVPMIYRRYLSPIYLGCSLGRTAGSNRYTNYRHLQGTINVSHNFHSLELYSGLIGAYLNANEPPNWFHNSLVPASEWLKQNNPLIRIYASNIIITTPDQKILYLFLYP